MTDRARHTTKAAVLLLGLSLTTSAAAQSDVEVALEEFAQLQSMSLEELLALPVWNVSTASKREEESKSAPATVFVMTKDDILVRGYANLVDVLRDLPGMELGEYSYSLIGTQVAVRGVLGNNKIVVLVNGMRVNPPGGDPMPFFSDFSVRNVEQIEIVYGPGSTLFGQDAINAVINVKTKRAGGDNWAEAGVGAGAPWRYEGWLNLNRKFGKTEINAHVRYYDANLTDRSKEFSDEWNRVFVPAYTGRTNADEYINNPKRWDTGLNAFGQLIHGKSSLQIWHRQASRSSSEGRQASMLFSKAAKFDDEATVAEGKNVMDLAPNVDLTSAIAFSRYVVHPNSRFMMISYTDPTGWLDVLKYQRESGVTFEETINAKVGERLKLLGGMLYGNYNITPLGNAPYNLNTSGDVGSQAGTIDYYTRQGDPTSLVRINKLNTLAYQSLGFYAEGTYKAIDRLQLLAGVRVDRDTRYDETPLSPRAAAIFDATKDLTVKAIYTQAYVAPAAYNMYDVYLISGLNGPNLNLKPERARSFELNAVFRRKNYMVSASGFYNTQQDLVIAGGIAGGTGVVNEKVYLSPAADAPAIKLTQDVNSGENTVYGGEIFGRYSTPHGRATTWGSYSYVHLENRNTDSVTGVTKISGLPGLAHHNFRFGATVNILREKLFLTASFTLRSTPQNLGTGYVVSRNTTLNGEMTEWPYELGVNVIYRAPYGIEAFGTFNNVTNHKYASIYDGTPYPAETVRGMMGLRYTFK